MSIAFGYYNGPALMLEDKSKRYSDREIRQLRSLDMLKRKQSGWSTQEIASYFRISTRYVNMEVADAYEFLKGDTTNG